MKRDVEVADPPVGFTWGKSDGEHYLKSTDGELRRLSDDGWRLLRALADGEVSKGDLDGTAREVVENLESEGYLHSNEPVVELRQPDPIRLWPRLLLFVGLVAIGLSVAWAEFPTMLAPNELARPSRLVPFAGLVVATIAIHEGGHYLASKPYFDPSVRVGLVNGTLPSVITETTQAWILPRNHRLWITLAGPFAQILWTLSVATVYYLVFPESALLSTFVVAMVVGTIFVLNPLIHGDGYLLLVDAFEMTDVRTTGIEHLRQRTVSLPAVYVVLSYGFGIGMTLLIAASVISFVW
ncbi:zinc metalloprotease [Halorussus amylolyticus]|uniref:hypothetical protein n=1 Tax=Halorussus amylolyticus TaxID=1126242 RepID=UPI001049C3CA|nr:hypothetical protein [Halorussus amylolyticus]